MPTLADDEALSSGITGRSRRRRKPKSTTPETDDVGEKEKENARVAKQTDVTISSQRSKSSKVAATKKVQKGSSASSKQAASCEFGCWASSYETDKEALRNFRVALEKISGEEVSLLSSMDAEIIEASQSIPRQPTEKSLSLQAESGDVLSAVRKLVKKATQSSKDVNFTDNSLYVALHGIRALSTFTNDAAKIEAIFRLLYHVIATASAAIPTSTISSKQSATSTKKSTKPVHNNRERIGFICLAAYETLGHMLLRYSVVATDKEVVVFQPIFGEHDSTSSMFPIPKRGGTNKKKSSSLTKGTMTLSQISTICTQSTMAAAKALVELSLQTNTDGGLLSSVWETFGREACHGDKSSSLSPEQSMMVHLIRTVSLSWVTFSCERAPENDVSTATKETLSHSKQSHLVLWNLASKIGKQKGQQSASLTQKLANQSLELRQNAIAALLLWSNGEIPKHMISPIRDKYFDSACTQAWKAATTFAKQSTRSPEDGRIRLFHDDVGSALDALALTMAVVAESMPYVEYCGYRAMHIGPVSISDSKCNHKKSSKRPCSFADLPFLYTHQQSLYGKEAGEHHMQATLALLFVMLQIQSHISSLLNPDGADQEGCNDDRFDISLANRIIDAFTDSFFGSDGQVPTSVQTSCFKLLSISFHSTVYKLLDTIARENEQVIQSFDQEKLLVTADILTKCLAPLSYSMIVADGSADNNQMTAYYWDVLTECYVRGAALLDTIRFADDALDSEEGLEKPSSVSVQHVDAILTQLHCRLTPQKKSKVCPPARAVGKAGKLLASMGKQRFNQNEAQSSLRPLLYSISICTSSATNDVDEESCSVAQFAARWSLISNVFHSLGWEEEAAASLLVSLHYEATISTTTTLNADNEFLVTLSLLAYQTKGVLFSAHAPIQMTSYGRSLINRLVNMISEEDKFWNNETIEAIEDDVSLTEVVHVLVESVTKCGNSNDQPKLSTIFMESTGSRLGLLGLLKATLAENDVSSKLAVLVEVIVSLGKKIQRSSSPDSQISGISLDIYRQLVDMAVDLIQTSHMVSNESELFAPVVTASIYLVASVSLLSYSPEFDYLALGVPVQDRISTDLTKNAGLPVAEEFGKLAWKNVCDNIDATSDLGLTYAAVRSTIYLYHSQLSDLTNTPSIALTTIEDLFNNNQLESISSGSGQSGLLGMAHVWTSFSLSRFRDRLTGKGDKLLAAHAALSTIVFPRSFSNVECWDIALTSELLLSAGLLENAIEFQRRDIPIGDNDDVNTTQSESSIRLAEAERTVSTIRIRFQSKPETDLKAAEAALVNALDAANAFEEEAPLILKFLAFRVKSSTYLALSEAAELRNDLSSSLKYLHRCFRSCQEVLGFGQEICCRDPDFPSWGFAVIGSIITTTRERRTHCLQRTAVLYGVIGDHRKSEAYSISALNASSCTSDEVRFKGKLADLISSFQSLPAASLQELDGRRLLLSIKAASTALDITRAELSTVPCEVLFSLPQDGTCENTENSMVQSDYEQIKCLIAVAEAMYGRSTDQGVNTRDLYDRAQHQYNRMISSHLFQSFTAPSPREGVHSLHHQILLGGRRAPLSQCNSETIPEQLQQTYNQIINSEVAPRSCRAEALYGLGLVELSRARETGDLQRLWNGSSCLGDTNRSRSRRTNGTSKSLKQARKYFRRALAVAGPPSELLTRQMLRCLALVTGPEMEDELSASSACVLVHTSIGGAARQLMNASLRSSPADSNVEYSCADIFAAFDVTFEKPEERNESLNSFFQEMKRLAPPDWKFVACALCPTGEILITSMEADADTGMGFSSQTICIFPVDDCAESHRFQLHQQAYERILEPLDEIISTSQQQLGGTMTSTEAAEKFSSDSAKRKWWDDRNKVDNDLRQHIEDVERRYFSTDLAKRVLIGEVDENHMDEDSDSDSCSSQSSSSLDAKICGDLTSKFEAALDFDGNKSKATKSRNRGSKFSCTFLILDEDLHRFPFEGMSLFAEKAVSRLPSLPFALASLQANARAIVDPREVRYILDPEANLSGTQQRLLPFIEELNSKIGCEWDGVAGEPPTTDFVEESLTTEDGLVLYCGHGGGQSCFSRTQLDRLQKAVGDTESCQEARRCQATVILMGCSSGKLESVNRKGTQSKGALPILFEPEGIALSYLMAGAPCVVGNLWDVTDHDIDRYCLSLLGSFFTDSAHSSLPHCVARARSACKMQFIVGCAPVCYGVPVHLIPNQS